MGTAALIRPAALRPGDPVAVVAPAGPAPAGRLRRGLARLAQRYRVRLVGPVFDRYGYLAAPDEQRAEALNRALSDPDLRAVFCARGGYGLLRVLPMLGGEFIRNDPKPVVGFSDITALLSWVQSHGVVAIHGPVVTQLGHLGGGDLGHLFDVLERPDHAVTLKAEPLRAQPRRAEGSLSGGNLSILASLAGTPWAVRLAGRLLFVEEVGEAPYRLDRLLTQLALQPAGFALGEVAGVAVGSLERCMVPLRVGPTALAAVAQRVISLTRGPALCGLPCGHGLRNAAIPLGAQAMLDARRGTLSWRGAVATG